MWLKPCPVAARGVFLCPSLLLSPLASDPCMPGLPHDRQRAQMPGSQLLSLGTLALHAGSYSGHHLPPASRDLASSLGNEH